LVSLEVPFLGTHRQTDSSPTCRIQKQYQPTGSDRAQVIIVLRMIIMTTVMILIIKV